MKHSSLAHPALFYTLHALQLPNRIGLISFPLTVRMSLKPTDGLRASAKPRVRVGQRQRGQARNLQAFPTPGLSQVVAAGSVQISAPAARVMRAYFGFLTGTKIDRGLNTVAEQRSLTSNSK